MPGFGGDVVRFGGEKFCLQNIPCREFCGGAEIGVDNDLRTNPAKARNFAGEWTVGRAGVEVEQVIPAGIEQVAVGASQFGTAAGNLVGETVESLVEKRQLFVGAQLFRVVENIFQRRFVIWIVAGEVVWGVCKDAPPVFHIFAVEGEGGEIASGRFQKGIAVFCREFGFAGKAVRFGLKVGVVGGRRRGQVGGKLTEHVVQRLGVGGVGPAAENYFVVAAGEKCGDLHRVGVGTGIEFKMQDFGGGGGAAPFCGDAAFAQKFDQILAFQQNGGQ